MRIQCPKCQSRFKIGDDKIPDQAVKVRCSRCKHVFRVQAKAQVPQRRASMSGVHDTTIAPSLSAKKDTGELFGVDDPFASDGGVASRQNASESVPFAGKRGARSGRNQTAQGAVAKSMIRRSSSSSLKATGRRRRGRARSQEAPAVPKADPFDMADPFEQTQLPQGDDPFGGLDEAANEAKSSPKSSRRRAKPVRRSTRERGGARRNSRQSSAASSPDSTDPFAEGNLSGLGGFTAFFADEDQRKPLEQPEVGQIHSTNEDFWEGSGGGGEDANIDPFSTQFPDQNESELGNLFDAPPLANEQGQSNDPFGSGSLFNDDPLAHQPSAQDDTSDMFGLGVPSSESVPPHEDPAPRMSNNRPEESDPFGASTNMFGETALADDPFNPMEIETNGADDLMPTQQTELPNDFLGDRERAMQFAPDFGNDDNDWNDGADYFDPNREEVDPNTPPAPSNTPTFAPPPLEEFNPGLATDDDDDGFNGGLGAQNFNPGLATDPPPAKAKSVDQPPTPTPSPDAPARQTKNSGGFVSASPQVSEIVVQNQSNPIQAFANIILIVMILSFGFLGFVALKNDGVLNFGDLGHQVKVAMGVASLEQVAAVPGTESGTTAPAKPRKLLRLEGLEQVDASNSKGRALFVLEGSVVNRSDTVYRAIMVEGTVYDADGAAVSTQQAPVGRTLAAEELLDVATAEDLKTLYTSVKDEAKELNVGPKEAARFSIVFPDLELKPEDKHTFKVKISSRKQVGAVKKAAK